MPGNEWFASRSTMKTIPCSSSVHVRAALANGRRSTPVETHLKEEEVCWNLYDGPYDARRSLAAYRECYNRVRPHWAFWPVGGGDPLVRADVYLDGLAVTITKWQGWALAAKEKLQQMKAEPQSPDGSGNLEISPEIFLETQIKCINPYPAN